ncbi:MAG: hypothetical protein KJN73_05010 [Acidimicrobiia bacterium]|nr:hypothetical protein [Acidimicrobiia bacterium]
MRTTARTDKKSRSGNWKPLKILALGLVIAAVIKELRLPQEERTWHGALGGFVPYDFRMPTMDKVKHTFWNPEGSIIVDRVFGVGWTINLGAVVAKVRSLAG